MTEVSGPKARQNGQDVKLLFRPSERFFLDANSPVPLYHQMEEIILNRIASERTVGFMLPRDHDLVTIFGVSRATTKKTTDNLVAKGVIRRKRAVGTWIVSLGMREDLGKLTGYTEQMAVRGLQVSTEVLKVEEHLPQILVRERLQLTENEPTLAIQRLRGTSEVFPIVLLHSEIPASFGIQIGEDFGASLYKLIEGKYHIPIDFADEDISAGRRHAR